MAIEEQSFSTLNKKTVNKQNIIKYYKTDKSENHNQLKIQKNKIKTKQISSASFPATI